MIIRDNFCYFCIKNVLNCHIKTELSSEPSHRHGSDESQHQVSMRNKKNYPSVIIKYPSYLELCCVYLLERSKLLH